MSKNAKFGILVFPGSNCERDCFHVLNEVFGQDATYVWHEEKNLDSFDALVLPGGFSYGDYLRTGAIARFAHVMESVQQYVEKERGLVIGICNGFQILTEAGLLPGALQRNVSLKFICKMVELQVKTASSPFTAKMKSRKNIVMPIAHGEGNYVCDSRTLEEMHKNKQILLTYVDNPNGSTDDIAGITNQNKTVFGLMPHPERVSELLLGSEDGRLIFESMISWIQSNS